MIFSLANWKITDVKQTDDFCRIYAEYLIQNTECEACRSPRLVKNGWRSTLFMDIRHEDKPTGIEVRRQQYICRQCNHPFYQHLPDMYEPQGENKRRDMTKRLVSKLIKEGGKYTFASVARDYGVAENTVKNIFMEYADECEKIRKIIAPKYLGIDELHFREGYRGVLANLDDKPKVLEILEDRRKRRVANMFWELSGYSFNSEQNPVKAIVMDMYKNYRDAAEKNLAGTRVVADKFHLLKMANRDLDDYRKSFTRKFVQSGLSDTEKKEINRASRLLQKNSAELTPTQLLQLEIWATKAPQLIEAYKVKEDFYAVFNSEDDKSMSRGYAESLYDDWIRNTPKHLYPYFARTRKAVENWNREIFNYFDQTPRLTNSPTENLNKRIRSAYDRGCGYSFRVLRAKILYGDAAEFFVEKKGSYPRSSERWRNSEWLSTLSRSSPSVNEDISGATETIWYQGADISKLIEMFDDDRF